MLTRKQTLSLVTFATAAALAAPAFVYVAGLLNALSSLAN